MKIYYGIETQYKDITQLCYDFCFYHNKIIIPEDDNLRAHIFGDPAFRVVKHIMIEDDNGVQKIYNDKERVEIEVLENKGNYVKSIEVPSNLIDYTNKLRYLHSKLILVDGSFQHEWNEQCMVSMFLDKNSKVLELGSNIGRNTMIVASFLNDDRNLVSLETDPVSVKSLEKNRFLNKFHFHIENAALSYKKLIQKDWVTIPSDVILPGYYPVNTITFEEIQEKYNIEFDTIVADCEGALYYILNDNENILKNIKMIILESDFFDESHKIYVEGKFRENGLEKIHSEPLLNQPDFIMKKFPKMCTDSFFEVWMR